MMAKHIHFRKVRTRGSTLVEFGLVAPILIFMLMGIMEFGWLAKNTLQMNNAVREGSRWLSMGKSTQTVSELVTKRCSPLTVTVTIDYSLDQGASYTPMPIDNTSPNQVPTTALSRVTATNTYQPLIGVIPGLKNRKISQNAQFGRE